MLLSDIRQLSKEIGLQTLIMDSFIPPQYQELIERNSIWDEISGDWHVVSVRDIRTLFLIIIVPYSAV